MNIKNIILNNIPLPIIRFLRDYKFQGASEKEMFRNIGVGVDYSCQPKVLLCYVTNTFHVQDWAKQKGTRGVECAALIESLVNNNCRIDVCAYNYDGTISNDYDYVMGFGPAYRKALERNPQAKSILYLTEKPPFYSLQKEKERIAYLYERHHIKASVNRSGLFFNDEDIDNADYIVMIGKNGDEKLLTSKKVFLISPTGLKSDGYDLKNKDFNKAKKHFLWMGSRGAVLKGLDILYDAFSEMPDLVLHVAGLDSVDRRMLSKIKPSNVIDHGYLQIGSESANKVFNECAFFLFPSCTEGVSTSTLTAMNFGLIPLITRETSVETNGIDYLKSFHVNDIVEEVEKWSEADSSTLSKQAELVRGFAKDRYSLNRYSQTMSHILQIIFNYEQ